MWERCDPLPEMPWESCDGAGASIIRLPDAISLDYLVAHTLGPIVVVDPPRITVRDRVLRGVGSDLDGVGSIKVYYPKRPDARMVRDTKIGLPEPYDELLVIDLARSMLSKTLDIEPESRIAAIQALSAEENDLLAAFEAHVRTFGPH